MSTVSKLSTAFLILSSVAASAAEEVDFAREVLPILSNKCFVCHGPDTQDEDELRLDSFEAATSDRGGYQAINPADPGESELLTRIHSTDDPMPPEDAEKQLTESERDVLSRWVKQGGKYAKHWSFVPPKRRHRFSNIDEYIARKQRAVDVDFARQAERSTLARRVALVLTGLPPEPEQLDAFLANKDEEKAYRQFVDMLLENPRFGEHQARYWLDAVRYGDTHGLHLDNRRGIYPYRDWVVKAFNENLPFDEFITWQLAGDLLPNPSLEQLVATGFVRMNPSTSEGGAIPAEFQAKNNFDRTETLGTVMLGMSMTCARCHTHKYDPIQQTEYYQLMAFFNSTAESAMDGNKYEYGPTIKVPKDQVGWQKWNAFEKSRDELLDSANAQCASIDEKAWKSASADERLAKIADPQGPFAKLPLHKSAQELAVQREKLEEGFTTSLVAKDLDEPRPTHILNRGEYHSPKGDPLQPDVLQVMGRLPNDAPRNRLGLARWLTSEEHPVVARVLINRIWQRVFGYALVRTTEDFGVQGQHPTHPELLDWLAVEFQDSGWDLKHMLRLMVNSRTFQQSSAWRTDVDDPENKLFARATSYRLDAEVLRDLGLWSSNLLDPHMGGEGVKPYQPSGMWMAMAHPASNTKKYERDKGELLYRRSLYVYWKRTSPHPMMTLFDAPDRESSCVRRSRTNTSLQSLGLLNETQRIEMSRKLAERLLKSASTTNARLDVLYKMLGCREPTESERKACTQLLESMQARFKAAEPDALKLLSIGDAPRDEKLDAVDLASWTQVAITVLASDIALVLY